MANYPSAPQDFTLSFLEHITNNFSDGVRIGSGGFGHVYWGIYRDEKIAVKKLYDQNPGFDDAAFKKEFNNSFQLHHPNIVRLVGYCYETREINMEVRPGDYQFVKRIVRILCYEYCQGGSLDNYINEKFRERDLDTRLKIIRGISEGLNYLHYGQAQHMYHMDLKPENILLDEKNMPKIADFGLSRFLAMTKTHITTSHTTGTLGYMPPEYFTGKKISNKFDVFSLGVIILEVLAVPLGYRKYDDMSPREFVEQKLERKATNDYLK
ncbi:cysteine-rich receptor-like protein kinase 29 [Panicum virgatum]|uniref:cysteine-rich receptor-like protein kinase 29 n=1 Tax=Panicum virgatum TaxID=38727 RepID=UPI0019D5EB64|nr:cysteine-rich receptor-like protein kinase 29 [Panicum virgatum]